MKYVDTIIVIPARFASTRLPGKSLLDINGLPMVIRVANIAKNLGLCDVVVASESEKVINIVSDYGYNAILTDSDLQSGTDRVYQAIQRIDNSYRYVINLQGDMPNIDGKIIENIADVLHKNENIDILTAVYKITDESWRHKPQCVKAVMSYNNGLDCHRCLYFSRSNIPSGAGDAFAHVGIYGYTNQSLSKFVSFPASRLEKSEKLEQLRAIENGMSVYAILVNSFPISVDVDEDLKMARELIK